MDIQPVGPNAVTVSSSGPGVGDPMFHWRNSQILPRTAPIEAVAVPFDAVNNGQTVTIRYTADVDADDVTVTPPAALSSFTAATRIGVTSDERNECNGGYDCCHSRFW